MSISSPSRPRLSGGIRSLLILAGVGLASPAFPTADSCAPASAALHDFQVGDVFQRRSHSTSSAGGAWPYTLEIRKYAIVSKTQEGDTTTYRIRGFSRLEKFPGGLPVTNITLTYKAITDGELKFIDSTRHILNQCQDALVALPGFPLASSAGGLLARVQISNGVPPIPQGGASSSPRPLKKLGGAGNVYRIPNGSPIPVSPEEALLEYVYAEGLGLVKYSEGYFETSISESLVGYARGGDTVGILEPDSFFQDPSTARIQALSGSDPGRKARGPLRDFLFPVPEGFAGRKGYDLRGRRFISFRDPVRNWR